VDDLHFTAEDRRLSMERYQVILAYDGSHYKGFQRQANALSVQGVIEDALHKLGWQEKSILAAGRTDTGVHATGQVIAFEMDWKHSVQDLQTALNSYLPADVVAREVHQVHHAFHPRHDASWRKYQYRIYCQAVRQPLFEPYAWRVWPAVKLADLQSAARPLVGTHDFGAFGTPPQAGGHTVRAVLQAGWQDEPPFLVFEIIAQAFLYHMVRRIVFRQVKIAQGKLSLDELQQTLDHGAAISLPPTDERARPVKLVHGLAPAQGLVLAGVIYPPAALQPDEEKR
jgi:tRNA pseudouridine38-40 synthase